MTRTEFLQKYQGKRIDPELLEGCWSFHKSTRCCSWETVLVIDEEYRFSVSVTLDEQYTVADVSEMAGSRLVGEAAAHCTFEEYDAKDCYGLCAEDFECALEE